MCLHFYQLQWCHSFHKPHQATKAVLHLLNMLCPPPSATALKVHMLREWIKILRERTRSQLAAGRAEDTNKGATEPPQLRSSNGGGQPGERLHCTVGKDMALEPEQLGCLPSPLYASVSPMWSRDNDSASHKAVVKTKRVSRGRAQSCVCPRKLLVCEIDLTYGTS